MNLFDYSKLYYIFVLIYLFKKKLSIMKKYILLKFLT